MSLRLRRASTQYLRAPTLITTFPFTFGCWVKMLSVSAVTNIIVSICDESTDNRIRVHINNAEDFGVFSFDGTTSSTATNTAGAITVNAWNYVIFRAIAANNLRLASWRGPNNVIQHTQATTSVTPTNLDVMVIGANIVSTAVQQPADMEIAEFWYTDTDIQPGGLQLQNPLFHQLAYGGPFSVPNVAAGLVEYRSFRSDILGTESDEVYCRTSARVWTQANNPSLGEQPPLLYQGVESQLIHPYSWRPLWELNKATGGPIDSSQSRTGTSTGTATATGRIAAQDEKRATVSATATVDADIAVQDAKRSTVSGTATVTGVSDFRNANWDKAGTSEGQATVVGRSAVQDAKRSTVSAGATATGTLIQETSLSRSGAAAGVAAVDADIAVQDAKRSTVDGTATVTGVSTYESAGSEVQVSGTSSGSATATVQEEIYIEIRAISDSSATVTGASTFTDESGGAAAVVTTRDAPFIVNVGSLMMR